MRRSLAGLLTFDDPPQSLQVIDRPACFVPFKIVGRNVSKPFESMMEELDKSAAVAAL